MAWDDDVGHAFHINRNKRLHHNQLDTQIHEQCIKAFRYSNRLTDFITFDENKKLQVHHSLNEIRLS